MLPIKCKMARTASVLGVRDLARRTIVSLDTIARLARGEALKANTIAALRAALESAGVEFTNCEASGVRPRRSAFP
jgi:transcriptional regulator with XRE-family HTH domain